MKCRRLGCLAPVEKFIRIQYIYADNLERGQTSFDVDEDYLYCTEHWNVHRQKYSHSTMGTFHVTLEGVRVNVTRED